MHVCMLMVDWSLSALYKCPCILWFPLAFRIKKTWKTKTRISFFLDLNKVVISLLYLYGLFYYLYPCPHPCPCSGSLYNQMLWTHDFDHMSLIYDIVTTFFCLAHNQEPQAIFLFQPFQLFVIIMRNLCYCWILPLCPSLILAPDRHCLLPARCLIYFSQRHHSKSLNHIVHKHNKNFPWSGLSESPNPSRSNRGRIRRDVPLWELHRRVSPRNPNQADNPQVLV